MLDAFEARIAPMLGHRVFNVRGECTLKRGTAEEWAEHWDIDDMLDEERTTFRKRLMGGLASPQRRSGFELLSGVFDEEQEESVTRAAMCDGGDAAAAQRWHRVQVRQAFRLALAPMTNDFVALLKDSSLVSVITVVELTKQTAIYATNIGSWVVPGALCALVYLMMSLPLSRAARRIEQRWHAP